MNAAASNLPHPTPIRAACFTPLSYFERVLDLEFTQLRCFGLILVETLGAYPSKTSAEISYDRFAESFRVSKDWIAAALASLERAGFIRISRGDRGAVTYSIRDEYIQEVKQAGREKIRGKCPDCKTVGLFSTEFKPIPHIVFRKLGGCVGSATFRAVMVVLRYTASWDKVNRCLEIEPAELNLDDFVRLTGLEKREITSGLTEAVKLGLIGRELRAGKPSLFWAIPENFGSLERRVLRQVTPSMSGGTKEAKPAEDETSKTANESAKTHANESGTYFYGRCDHCGHLVNIEPVSEDEFASNAPAEPIKSSSNVKKPPSGAKKSAFFEELERKKREAVAAAFKRFGIA